MAISFPRPRLIDIVAWCLLAAAVIFAIHVRWRLREFPLERDEGEFAYAGQLLLQGVPPYKLAYNMKLPGTYIAYAALMAVFGQTIAGVHLGLLAVNVATILLLYRLTRELFDPISGGLAAVFYAIVSVNPGVLGMCAHATHFVAFFGVAGVWLLWRYLRTPRWWSLLASGFLLGTAFLMKQQGVFLMVFGGAVMTVHTAVGLVKASRGQVAAKGTVPFLPARDLQADHASTVPAPGAPQKSGQSPRSRPMLVAQAAAFCAAAVLPYLLVCLWLWRVGVFDKFWFWTVTYAREYVQEVSWGSAWRQFWYGGEGIHAIESDGVAWLLALAGVAVLVIRGWARPGRSLFVLGFFVFSFLCVCPGFFFRSHYFIVALPAVAMLAGVACGEFLHLAGLWRLRLAAAPAAAKGPPGRRRKPLPKPVAEPPAATFAPLVIPGALLVLAAIVWPLCDQRKNPFYFQPPSAQLCQQLKESPAEVLCHVTYSGNPFVEAPVISRILNEHMKDDDTVAVLGSEPEIPFYLHRHSATGYIYTYGLMEVQPSADGLMKPQPLAERMQKEMIAEIERAKPEYILVVDCRCSWLYYPASLLYLHNWASRYLREKYEVVGLIERPAHGPQEPPRAISYRWSESKQSETPIAKVFTNDKGELAALAWLGRFDGIQPNPFAAECTVWVCRRK